MFNTVLHNPIRTKIVALLSSNDEVSFKELKTQLELTDGNLNGHIKVLNKEQYLEINKFFDGNKPKTVYSLSDKGKKAFITYLDELKSFIESNN